MRKLALNKKKNTVDIYIHVLVLGVGVDVFKKEEGVEI